MKRRVFLGLVASTLLMAVPAFGATGGWKRDNKGWWYSLDDGSYYRNYWFLDKGKYYFFNSDGYMVTDKWVGSYYLGSDGVMLTNTTTPDGYKVGGDGKWIPDDNTGSGFTGNYMVLLSSTDSFAYATVSENTWTLKGFWSKTTDEVYSWYRDERILKITDTTEFYEVNRGRKSSVSRQVFEDAMRNKSAQTVGVNVNIENDVIVSAGLYKVIK